MCTETCSENLRDAKLKAAEVKSIEEEVAIEMSHHEELYLHFLQQEKHHYVCNTVLQKLVQLSVVTVTSYEN